MASAKDALSDLVQIDVLDGGTTAKGTYLGAIRLTLSEGWKTYWRAPGDTGIPPSFSWRGSDNVGHMTMTWPTPEVFDSNGSQTIGYSRQLVLPVEITPSVDGKKVRLKGHIEFGLCSDVCIPASLEFDRNIDPTSARNPVIAAALAQRPYSAREAKVSKATCSLSPTETGIQVQTNITMPSAGGDEIVVIEPGDPQIWAGETRTSRKGNTLSATTELISGTGQTFALDRSKIRITVLGQSHSVDIQGCSAG